MIERHEVVQRLLSATSGRTYLEVGVFDGATFLKIDAETKVAVDPKFQLDRSSLGAESHFYEMTSDEFFGQHVGAYPTFDVIYLDGLHTFEQTLRDLINAMSHLTAGGVILIDDVLPGTYQASLKTMELAFQVGDFLQNGDRAWMGDVYRLVYFIETFFQSWSYATVEDNHGQLVLWEQARAAVRERSVATVASLSFEAVVTQREAFRLKALSEIVQDLNRRTVRRLGAAGAGVIST